MRQPLRRKGWILPLFLTFKEIDTEEGFGDLKNETINAPKPNIAGYLNIFTLGKSPSRKHRVIHFTTLKNKEPSLWPTNKSINRNVQHM